MKKLLLIGGNTIHTYNFYRLIEDYFDEILVISNHKIEDDTIKSVVCNFSLKNPLTALKTIQRIKEISLDFDPTIVHVLQANSYSFLSLLAVKNKYKTIVTALGSDILINSKGGFLLKQILRYVLKNGDGFTADATFVGEVMNTFVGKDLNVLTANFGIDPIDYKTEDKEKIIFSNRSHAPLYNIDKVIDFFKAFKASDFGKDYKLVIAARGPLTDELKDYVKSEGLNDSIEFVGFLTLEENTNYYRKSEFFISIPSSDATSISLLEAISAGCYSIVSNLPANHEWVKEGVNGCFFGSIEQLIPKLSSVDKEALYQLNKDLTENHSTKKINRQKYLSLYERTLQN